MRLFTLQGHHEVNMIRNQFIIRCDYGYSLDLGVAELADFDL